MPSAVLTKRFELSFFRFSIGPKAAILCSAILWGTFWIPLRRLNETGLTGSWATTASFALCLLLFLPYGIRHRKRIREGGWQVFAAGLFLALAVALYSEGIVRGLVARVILLFYLTPVWSSLLGRLMLGEELTLHRVLTICLGLAGLGVILGGESGLPVPRSVGDWMGLTAGIAWALAAVYVRRTEAQPIGDRSFLQFLFLAPLFFLVTRIPGGEEGMGISTDALIVSLPWLIALAAIWLIPATWLIVSGASRLDPGRVAVFLMLEIVIGISTATLWAEEPFGSREVIGAFLILSAGGFEVLGTRRARQATSSPDLSG